MRPRVVVFQHAPYCPLETLLEDMNTDGIEPVIVDFSAGGVIPALEDFDAMIALGGAMDVWQEDTNPWLVHEKAAIRRWVREFDRPYLGICLGHQLLADALGGTVGPAAKPEAFIVDVPIVDEARSSPLLQGFGTTKRALQWHGSEVKSLPPGATLLSSTPDCAVTVFKAGSAAYGVQYHPEVTVQLVDAWCALPSVQRLIESVHGPRATAIVHDDMMREAAQLRQNAARLYRNFMHIVRTSAVRTSAPLAGTQ